MIYDLTVVGGGTAGCAAAYCAGKAGLKVLLLEKNIHLGGSITSALVIPAMNAGKNQINTTFFDDLTSELHSMGGQTTYLENKGWFNPELTKIALDSLLQKAKVDVLFGVHIQDITLSKRAIKSITISSKMLSVYNEMIQNANSGLSRPIDTRYVIDATGNCEIGQLCGCNFIDKENETQPASLRFIMSGINMNTFADWLENFDMDRNVTTVERTGNAVHLSTACTWDDRNWALKPLFDDAVDKGILENEDRNYFQIFSIAGMPSSIAFNCPRILKTCDITDIYNASTALQVGRQSILRITEFCKTYFPGFEKAYISNIADMLGIRVSKRIKGKYIYTEEDLKSGKKFKNPALISTYPIDIHSDKKNASSLEEVREYQLPIESLISADIDNLLVAGRCISADFKAQGALRIQPSCFSMGEAAAKYVISNL